jgi:hypothetical protein
MKHLKSKGLRSVLVSVASLGIAGGCMGASTDGAASHESQRASCVAGTCTFESGALILPVDTTPDNDHALGAYGLVYQLLRNGVPVHWAIRADKQPIASLPSDAAVDFTIPQGGTDAAAVIRDLGKSAEVPLPSKYRGGSSSTPRTATPRDRSSTSGSRPGRPPWSTRSPARSGPGSRGR